MSDNPVVVLSDDDEDFEINTIPRADSRIAPGKAKRKLPFDNVRSNSLSSDTRFGGGCIDANDSHRHDVGSSSGIAPSHRRQLVTSVFSETVKWIAVEPNSKVWVDKKRRAMTEDLRMIAKPVAAAGKRSKEWEFQVLL